MLLFFIAALRAIVEMLGLALLGLAAMSVLAGSRRHSNPIYRLFELLTRAPRRLVGAILPATTPPFVIGLLCFILLFVVWIGLALWRFALV